MTFQVGEFFSCLHASSPSELEASLALTHIPLSSEETTNGQDEEQEVPVAILGLVAFPPPPPPSSATEEEVKAYGTLASRLAESFDSVRHFAAGRRLLMPLHDAPR